jgi:DNA polymerase IV
MEIFREFTDLVEPVSIDEAFLDVTGSLRLFGTGEEIARKVKARVQTVERLTASVGVAANKFVAKIASDLRKPDGLVVVEPGREKEFLDPLPIGRLWGVGRKTEEALRRLGIERIGQLAAWDEAGLVRRFGASGAHLHELSQGLDTRAVSPVEGLKSIGHETTFERDTLDRDLLRATLLGLTGKVAHRLRANHSRARTIAVKVREEDFSTRTRRRTLEEPSDTEERIYPVALALMESLLRPRVPIRLIGIYGTTLEPDRSAQLDLFPAGKRRDEKLAAALDDINRRFGDRAITRAALVRRSSPGRD